MIIAAIAFCSMACPPLVSAAGFGTGRSSPASLTGKQREREAYINTRHALFLSGQTYFQKAGDSGKAAKLWRKAARMCDTDAQSSLGYLYYIGMGVAQSYKQAMKWYRKAAEAGAPDAQYSLAVMYYRGLGVPQDKVQAMAWFMTAVASGNGDAVEELRFTRKNASPRQRSQARTLARRIQGMPRSAECSPSPALQSANSPNLLATNEQ